MSFSFPHQCSLWFSRDVVAFGVILLFIFLLFLLYRVFGLNVTLSSPPFLCVCVYVCVCVQGAVGGCVGGLEVCIARVKWMD